MSDHPSRRAIRYLSRRDYRHIINQDTTEAGDHWSRLFEHYNHYGQDSVMPWVMRKTPIEVSGGWTVSTLLEYINARISDMELRNQQRFEAQIDASNSRSADMELRQQQRFEAQTKAIEAAITAQRTAIDAALIAANQATAKAEVATEMRFVGITSLQNTVTTQMASLITRKEAEALANRNTERIQEMTTRLQAFVPRDVVMAEYDRISVQVQDIADRLTRSEGKGAGINALWVYILGAVAAIGTIVSLYIAYK
jgi:hypothetical protein